MSPLGVPFLVDDRRIWLIHNLLQIFDQLLTFGRDAQLHLAAGTAQFGVHHQSALSDRGIRFRYPVIYCPHGRPCEELTDDLVVRRSRTLLTVAGRITVNYDSRAMLPEAVP